MGGGPLQVDYFSQVMWKSCLAAMLQNLKVLGCKSRSTGVIKLPILGGIKQYTLYGNFDGFPDLTMH